jgi:hypothetical protein
MNLLPTLVAHADWGSHPQKRWLVRATRQHDGRYLAHPPELVGAAETLVDRLLSAAGPAGIVLLGFDFPIGLPRQFARQAGIDDFSTLLPQLGQGRWRDFYEVAEHPAEISLTRPFYPKRPGGTRQKQLLDQLGFTSMNDLRRRCDFARPGRRAASPLFWTLGGQQVGKAALNGWQSILVPALRSQTIDAVIWPFAGPLFDLFQPGRVVFAETYPAECYDHLGVTFLRRPGRRSGKRVQGARMENGPALLAWAKDKKMILSTELRTAIETGFGPGPNGEDPFDATVGLFGMLNIISGYRPPGTPDDEHIRKIEGWILGQQPDSTPSG